VVLSKEAMDGLVAPYEAPGGNGTVHLTLEAPLVGRLPPRDYGAKGRHASCALVGNSGTLLGSKFGPEIDAHEAVMRINYAPIAAFAADVGRKTTYDFSNRENARRLLTSNSVEWRTGKGSTILFFEVGSPTNRKKLFGPLLAKFPNKAIHFLHPGFVLRGLSLWHEFKAELERRRSANYHDKPMSGFYAVLAMMQMCESLDVYGFEPYTKKTAIPYHYFDAVQGVTEHHSFDFAIYLYQMLAEEYPLSIKKNPNLR